MIQQQDINHTGGGNLLLIPDMTAAMSAVHDRRMRQQSETDWRAYEVDRAYFVDLYPQVFVPRGRKKIPLACGIKEEMIGAGYDPYQVQNFLRGYTFGPKYLAQIYPGVVRIGLDGNPAGVVTESDASYAAACLLHHRMVWPPKRKTILNG